MHKLSEIDRASALLATYILSGFIATAFVFIRLTIIGINYVKVNYSKEEREGNIYEKKERQAKGFQLIRQTIITRNIPLKLFTNNQWLENKVIDR